MSAASAVVSALTVYPVKGMRGIELESARLTPAGLAHDRAFMVVRRDGRLVTQRDCPKLALIGTALDEDDLAAAALSERFHRWHRLWSEVGVGPMLQAVLDDDRFRAPRRAAAWRGQRRQRMTVLQQQTQRKVRPLRMPDAGAHAAARHKTMKEMRHKRQPDKI